MGAPPPSESTKLVGDAAASEPVGLKAMIKHHSELIFAVAFFMCCSSGMLLVNKAVMLEWNLPITVTIIQLAFCCVSLCFFPWTLRVGSWADARRWAIAVPWLFAVMLATSMLALHYSTTGAVVVTRNIAPIITLAIEAVAKEKVAVDLWTVLALLYTLIGVILYMANDISFSLIGFVCMCINMTAAVFERIVERRLLAVEPVDISKMALVLITNVVAIAPVSLILWPTHEAKDWPTLRMYDDDGVKQHEWTAYLYLVLSCVVGVAIGWAGVNAQYYLTATSFLVLGNVNKFIVIGVGMAFMGEASSWQAVVGCFIAITGGLAYASARRKLDNKKKAEAEAKAAEAKAADAKAP